MPAISTHCWPVISSSPTSIRCNWHPNAAGTRGRLTSNYAEVQASLAAEHGAANVYLISRRFLDWATPERLAGDFAKASLRTGGSVVGELAEAGAKFNSSTKTWPPGSGSRASRTSGRILRGPGRADSHGLVPATGPFGQNQAGRIHAPA